MLQPPGLLPLVHYLERGVSEGCDPNPLFDSRWYLQRNPDVAAAGMNPLLHYLRFGAAEKRDPHPLFSMAWYLQQIQRLRPREKIRCCIICNLAAVRDTIRIRCSTRNGIFSATRMLQPRAFYRLSIILSAA